MKMSFFFKWFLANYTYQLALAKTEAGMVNLLSSTSSFFTLILAALYPSNASDRFTLSKCFAVAISLCGLVSAHCYNLIDSLQLLSNISKSINYLHSFSYYPFATADRINFRFWSAFPI